MKCVSGYDKIIDYSVSDDIIVLWNDVPVEEENNDTYRIIKSVCETFNLVNRMPSNIDVPIFTNCEYWYKFATFNQKGCARCTHRNYGEVKNWEV